MVGSLASVRVIQLSPGLGGRMGVFRFVSRKSELGRLETYVCTVWKWNDVIQIQGINCTCTRRHSQGICMEYGSRDFYLLKDRGSNFGGKDYQRGNLCDLLLSHLTCKVNI